MTAARKRHLLIRKRAACGVAAPLLTTTDPAKVTCGACRQTLAMADAEVLARRKRTLRAVK